MSVQNKKSLLHIDTNILIRLATGEPLFQIDLLEKFFSHAQPKSHPQFFINSLVMLETFQVLTGRIYQMTPQTAAQSMLEIIFDTDTFLVQETDYHFQTLKFLLSDQHSSIDYTDAFLFAQASSNNQNILSFDQDFDKLQPKLRISLD